MSEQQEPQQQATIRRAPKMAMFLVVGGALGAVVTFILTALYPADEAVGFGPLLGYFMLYGVPAGVVLGAVVALILDRVSRRHVTEVTVEHESVVESPDTTIEVPAESEQAELESHVGEEPPER